jgi:hypothetical protein
MGGPRLRRGLWAGLLALWVMLPALVVPLHGDPLEGFPYFLIGAPWSILLPPALGPGASQRLVVVTMALCALLNEFLLVAAWFGMRRALGSRGRVVPSAGRPSPRTTALLAATSGAMAVHAALAPEQGLVVYLLSGLPWSILLGGPYWFLPDRGIAVVSALCTALNVALVASVLAGRRRPLAGHGA